MAETLFTEALTASGPSWARDFVRALLEDDDAAFAACYEERRDDWALLRILAERPCGASAAECAALLGWPISKTLDHLMRLEKRRFTGRGEREAWACTPLGGSVVWSDLFSPAENHPPR